MYINVYKNSRYNTGTGTWCGNKMKINWIYKYCEEGEYERESSNLQQMSFPSLLDAFSLILAPLD